MHKWKLKLPLQKLGPVIALLIGLIIPLKTFGQVYTSRDNHTNLWQNRSAWEQNWAGIAAPTNITDAEAHVYGYVTHGLAGTPDSLAFTGTTGKLVVQDTLRIHGNLNMYNGASLHIKPGGILIVHGNYEQEANVNFINEGQAIFVGDWTALGNSGSFSNTGNLYVDGAVAEGGNSTLYQPFSALRNDNYLLYYFTYVRVISAVCSGNNHDTLTFSGDYQRVIRWESSLSFFGNDTTFIDNQTETQLYTNLLQTTSYRVYYETKPPMPQYKYSTGASIVVLENSVGGSLSGPAAVCSDSSGTLSLSDFIGEVIRWESSTDGFNTDVTVVANGGESFTFGNLTETTSYRAAVRNGDCNEAYSSVHTVHVSPASKGGTLAGSTEVCADVNSGELSLSDYTGDIVSWESSTDDFATVTSIAHTSAILTYSNLSQTTSYRVVVQSGACSYAYSTVATITVSSIAGGSLSGAQTVCAGENSGELQLSSWQGDILRWESSADGFATVTTIAHTTELYPFQNLQETTRFRAVVGNAVCGETFSSEVEVAVDQQPVGGELTPATTAVCAGSNEGLLSLQNYSGEIVRWETSVDGFATFETLAHTAAEYQFTNLAQTTSYRVILINGVCGEVSSVISTVQVDQQPVGGTIDGGNIHVCADANSGSLSLTGYFGEIVRWESSTDNFASDIQPITNTGAELSYQNLSQTTSYRAVVGNGTCQEVTSEASTIFVDEPAVGGSVAADQTEVCSGGNAGTLSLQNYVGQIVRWESSTDGFATANSIAHTTELYPFQNLQETTRFRAVVGNAVCGETFSSEVEVAVDQPAVGGELTPTTTAVCAGENSGSLQLESYSGSILRWESSTDGFINDIQTINQSTGQLAYQNLEQTTAYRVVVGTAACGEVYSATATVTVEAPSAGGELAGSRRLKAGENSGLLELQNQQGTILQWEFSTDNFERDIQVLEHTDSSLAYENVDTETWYRVMVQNNECTPAYSEAARLWINQAPIALADTFHIQVGTAFSSSSSLLENDYDPDGDALLITPGQQLTTAAGNGLSIDEKGYISYQPQLDFIGADSLQYSVCDVAGEVSRCAYSWVVLYVEKEMPEGAPVLVYQGVSPNGDGLNDSWIIDYIALYPSNLVQLFDRYGVLVYEVTGYNNQDKVFDGFSNRGNPGGDGSLPEATYYYRIRLNADLPVLKGYVILNR
jgi:gliding motility-associated-like protein